VWGKAPAAKVAEVQDCDIFVWKIHLQRCI